MTPQGLVDQNIVCIEDMFGVGRKTEIGQRVHNKNEEERPKNGPLRDARSGTYCLRGAAVKNNSLGSPIRIFNCLFLVHP